MEKTKHDIVIEYIESLPIGEKVSVRQLARQMNISEGTVYRAIKDAENQGLVSSIPKVGTIRIELVKERSIESLTYYELAFIVEGKLLSGLNQSDVAPKAFFVANNLARLKEKKLHASTMIICEFDEALLSYAKEQQIPVLLTGGGEITQQDFISSLPEDQVIISTPYDAFDAISAINQAIGDRVQQREMITIADIMTTDPYVLHGDNTIKEWRSLSQTTEHSRFPVVNEEGRLEGMITAFDVADKSADTLIKDVMTANPVVVHSDALVSYLGRLLVLEKVDLVPVVDQDAILLGVVSRKDVIEAQQTMQKQPHLGDTSDNIIMSGFSIVAREPEVILSGRVTPYMLDEYGSVSLGVCNVFGSNAAVIALRIQKNLLGQAYQSYTHFYRNIGTNADVYLVPNLSGNSSHYHASVRLEAADGSLMAVTEVDMLIRDK